MNTKEAIERIKTRFDKWVLDEEDMKAIQTLISELKESNDEKTRKEIIQFFKDASNGKTRVITSETFAKWAEFLEKQKEHKTKIDACGFPLRDKGESASSYLERCLAPDMRGIWYEACAEIKMAIQEQESTEWSENDRIINELITIVRSIGGVVTIPNNQEELIAYLEKQKKHKSTAEEVLIKAGLKVFKDGDQWCILIGDNIQEGVCGFGDTIEDALFEFLEEICKQNKTIEWGENERIVLDSIIDDYEKAAKSFCGYDGKIMLLKAIRDGKYDLSKQAWSQADETAFNDLMWCIEQARKSAKDENDMGNIWFAEKWIKDILKYICSQVKQKDRYMEGYIKGFVDAEKTYNNGVPYYIDNPNTYKLDPNVVINSTTSGTNVDYHY